MERTKNQKIQQVHVPLILRDVLRNWWLVVMAAVIGAIGVFVYGNLIYTPQYTSEVTFTISPRSNGSYVGFYASLNTANEMAEVFQEVFKSDVLKRMIREDLQDPSIPVKVSAEVETGTNILRVTATADTPAKAHAVMESVLKNYGEVSGYLFGGVVLDPLKTPQVPTQPSNGMQPVAATVLVSLLCGALMVGLIVSLSMGHKTVKTVEGAKAYMGEAPLGVLVHEKSADPGKGKKKGLLITRTTIGFSYVEAVLQLAHKITHRMQKNNRQVLLVTSVAENEGKSTIAGNLAIAMARHGRRVALLDMDMRRPALHKLFSEFSQGYDLLECLQSGLPETLDPEASLFRFTLNGPCSQVSQILHSKNFEDLLTQLKETVDLVILDSAPYMAVADTGMLLKHADSCVMVMRQDWVPGNVLHSVAEELDEEKAEYLGYILNDFYDDGTLRVSKKYYDQYSYYGKRHREEAQ